MRVKSGEGREKKKEERGEKQEKMERFKMSVLVKLKGGMENVRR